MFNLSVSILLQLNDDDLLYSGEEEVVLEEGGNKGKGSEDDDDDDDDDDKWVQLAMEKGTLRQLRRQQRMKLYRH